MTLRRRSGFDSILYVVIGVKKKEMRERFE